VQNISHGTRTPQRIYPLRADKPDLLKRKGH